MPRRSRASLSITSGTYRDSRFFWAPYRCFRHRHLPHAAIMEALPRMHHAYLVLFTKGTISLLAHAEVARQSGK